jgi:hypothetical protein
MHIVQVCDRSAQELRIYKNGAEQGTATNISTIGSVSNSYRLQFPHAGSYDADGLLDEVRISSGVRDACWIEAEHNNQSNPDGFYTIGIEEQPGTVGDPFQNGWTYRKRLTIDASRVAGDLTNFPVLISTTDEDWKEDSQAIPGHVAQTDGGDIIFTAGDGVTKLDHEIEKYDETTPRRGREPVEPFRCVG